MSLGSKRLDESLDNWLTQCPEEYLNKEVVIEKVTHSKTKCKIINCLEVRVPREEKCKNCEYWCNNE